MRFRIPLPSRETIIAFFLFLFILTIIIASAGPPRSLIYQGF